MSDILQNAAQAAMPPTGAPVVELCGVSKRYFLHPQKLFLLRQMARWITGRRAKLSEFWALQDVDLRVEAGESVALIGRNGAGKSTLLGVIAGTVFPSHGSAVIRGRIGGLLELGAGFHLDLTGRENIFLNASLLGLNRQETLAQFDAIVAFSELENFIDEPLRTDSSGMQMRLGFAVAVHIQPDILLMDEVFAVGDLQFQEKCARRIRELRDSGCTLFFVSHNVAAVSTLCRRVIWLEGGRVHRDGPTQEVLAEYAGHT